MAGLGYEKTGAFFDVVLLWSTGPRKYIQNALFPVFRSDNIKYLKMNMHSILP